MYCWILPGWKFSGHSYLTCMFLQEINLEVTWYSYLSHIPFMETTFNWIELFTKTLKAVYLDLPFGILHIWVLLSAVKVLLSCSVELVVIRWHCSYNCIAPTHAMCLRQLKCIHLGSYHLLAGGGTSVCEGQSSVFLVSPFWPVSEFWSLPCEHLKNFGPPPWLKLKKFWSPARPTKQILVPPLSI